MRKKKYPTLMGSDNKRMGYFLVDVTRRRWGALQKWFQPFDLKTVGHLPMYNRMEKCTL